VGGRRLHRNIRLIVRIVTFLADYKAACLCISPACRVASWQLPMWVWICEPSSQLYITRDEVSHATQRSSSISSIIAVDAAMNDDEVKAQYRCWSWCSLMKWTSLALNDEWQGPARRQLDRHMLVGRKWAGRHHVWCITNRPYCIRNSSLHVSFKKSSQSQCLYRSSLLPHYMQEYVSWVNVI